MMGVIDMISSAGKNVLIAIFVVAISGLFSCGEKSPPAPQTQIVKKKIDGQQNKAKSKSDAPQAKTEAAGPSGKAESTVAEKVKKADMSKLVKESMAFAGSYDPKGRFDPFEPLLKNDTGKPLSNLKGKKRRVPQTPLERVAISQLKLSAIMRSNSGNSAIVEDATGKGFVIRKGTYIGLNSGQVTQIDKSSVMIEEEIEDVSGEFRIQNIELKLQKPAGEL